MKQKRRVAIQGVSGANHEIAAREFFRDYDVEVVPCLTFEDLFRRVREEDDLYGICAIENTLVGSIQANYTLLKDSGLEVIGEHKLRIKHNLMALPGVGMEDIREVHSHPMASAKPSSKTTPKSASSRAKTPPSRPKRWRTKASATWRP